ncbi:hypothetical protein ACGFYQ_18795 [Streptomyces sp. NPDC048258]|uniref:hypothetical protein n=1 Tax=Streptomyces sp. NPDC048258 TaxID=3365527 RepID=UPI00371CCBB9
MIGFSLFLVRVQWIDRKATSSFLIGITLQTLMLTVALHGQATDAGHALVLATRAALLTCVTIVLLSAMSSVQNEFRYGTMESVLLGRLSLFRLLAVRAAACAVVTSPAIVVPYIGAAVKFPSLIAPRTAVLIAMVYVCLAAICYQSTLTLCQFTRPAAAVPWFRMVLLVIGLSVAPFPGADTAALILPCGWVLRFAGETRGLTTVLTFLMVAIAWTVALWLIFRNSVGRRIERALTDGRAAL